MIRFVSSNGCLKALRLVLVVVLLAPAAGLAGPAGRDTQETPTPTPTPAPTATPSPSPSPSAEPTPPPIRLSPRTKMTVPARMAPILGGSAKDAGPLSSVRALEIGEAEARLVIQGAERVVRVGDAIGSDLVKSISPGRVVLLRPAAAGGPAGESLVILQFDPQGRAQVLVIATQDTTSKPPRDLK